MKNVSIILSYPKESFQKEGSLKAFISTDLVLKPLDIIFKYTDRWAIEPFFRDCKNYLGLDSYQVRSERSILRYLTIMFITYTYCKLYSSKTLQSLKNGSIAHLSVYLNIISKGFNTRSVDINAFKEPSF
ncbi:hypothetical protein Z961_12540 [Clostridium haemolyticum NCTC 8350]|nr:hypothetical protein Z961_12540 [Clostridium haemolyticum NCTC 8350]